MPTLPAFESQTTLPPVVRSRPVERFVRALDPLALGEQLRWFGEGVGYETCMQAMRVGAFERRTRVEH